MPTADPQLKSKRRFCVKCGKDYTGHQTICLDCSGPVVALTDQGEARAGRVLAGKYLLLEPLGEGGMGSVFRAQQKNLGRLVAVKLLRLTGSDRPASLRRFYGEAKHTSRLSHPHNVKVFDFGHTEDGLLFIVMELVSGSPLSAVELPLEPARALRIIEQVCSALAEAHEVGLIHRDLKPENIMLSQVDGRDFVRVLDYGVAKSSRSTLITDEGSVVGTPLYMSPEQVSSELLDARSDIYALGAVLYELVTGRPPFEAPDYLTVVYKHKHESPPPPSRFRSIPPQLERLILSCLAKDRAKRPESASALRGQILALLDEVGALEGTATPPPDDGAASSRRSLALASTEPARTPDRLSPVTSGSGRILAVGRSALLLLGAVIVAALVAWPREPDTTEVTEPSVASLDGLTEPSGPEAAASTELPERVDPPLAPASSADHSMALSDASAVVGQAIEVAERALGTYSDDRQPPVFEGETQAERVEDSERGRGEHSGPIQVRPRPLRRERDEDPDRSRTPQNRDELEVAESDGGQAIESPNTAADRLRSLTGDLLEGPSPLPDTGDTPRVVEP